MKKFFNIILAVLAGLFLLAVSAQSLVVPEEREEELDLSALVLEAERFVEKEINAGIDEFPIQDNMDLYRYDDPASVVTLYVTVRVGNPSDNTDHTWQEVNDFVKFVDRVVITRELDKAEVIVQIGNEDGPLLGELGFGEIVPNATIQIRGQSATLTSQKSYKIELRDRAGDWRGQTTISLNKHKWDETRIKNKLSFDLLKDIPNIVSLRTQFVNLYVKDETTDPPGETFIDYGLFTQIEQPNRGFLRNHHLDQDGQLYKPSSFEFFRYPDQIRLANDPLYDEEIFSTILEIKGNRDHSKLINMLEDVNNYAVPIEHVFEEHFNADNYFTWIAFNILVGNEDILTQDYYLYSPQNGKTWYFIPWDYDGALHRVESEIFGSSPYHPFAQGIGTFWGVVLHRRVLEVEQYRQLLDVKITELKDFLTPERIDGLITSYRTVTDEFVSNMPDVINLGIDLEEYDLRLEMLPDEIELNYKLYLEDLDTPMPFFLGTPTMTNGMMRFNWGESYDFDAQDIDYHFLVSRDWEFQNVVVDEIITNLTAIQIPMLVPGTYFWQVAAINEDGKRKYAFDNYYDAERNKHTGMKILYITDDGQVLEE